MTVREFRASTAKLWEVLRRDGEVLITSNGTAFGRLIPPEPAGEAPKSRFESLIRAGHQQIAERERLFWEKLADVECYHPRIVERVELSDDEWDAFWGVIGRE